MKKLLLLLAFVTLAIQASIRTNETTNGVTGGITTGTSVTLENGLFKRGLDVSLVQNASSPAIASNILYSDYQATLADGVDIDSGWLDMGKLDKIQFSGYASAAGMTMTIDSRSDASQTALSTPVTYTDGTFYMFNIIVRQRYMRFKWTNNTGAPVTNVSMELKASYGSSDKLSVFPVGVNPDTFSQAALVQSISRGKQPDGDYVAIPADGAAFTTSATLAADAEYTSAWTDSDGWNSIDIFFDSDVVSAFQGIIVEYTDDTGAGSPTVKGSNVFTFTQDMVDNGFESIKLPVALDGFRVRYINGPTIQSEFFMEATLRTNGSNDKYNKGGALLTSSFETEVALGLVPNYSNNTKFGKVEAIDTADNPVDIWAFADDTASPRVDTKTFPTTASTFYIASSSTSDTDVDVLISYIDADGYAQSTSINLNGRTPVSIGSTALDVNRMKVDGATAAVGAIYVVSANNFTNGTPTTPSQTLAVIPVGYGQSQLSNFTVPRGKKLIIKAFNVMISRGNGSAGSAEVRLIVKEFGKTPLVKREYFPSNSVPVNAANANIVVKERANIAWRLHEVSDSDTNVSATWDYELIDL